MEVDIKLIVLDVDGTLTDSGIYYDENGNEMKKFSTKDAIGIYAAQKAGMQVMVLTGRECAATTRRINELKVDYAFQNVKDKKAFLFNFMNENSLKKENVCYIGDDLNDFPAMDLAGYIGCPADGCKEIIERADYVSIINGGHGAVRDVIEHVLREKQMWSKIIGDMLL